MGCKLSANVDNQAPILAPIGAKTADESDLLEFTIAAVDPDGAIPVLMTSGLPSGANFSDSQNGTGVFSWTPMFAQVGVYVLTFIASDGSLADSEIVPITVNSGLPPPNPDFVLSVSDTSASPADTGIIVNVNLKNFEAVAGAQIRLTYDSTLLAMNSPPFSKPPRASQMDFFNGNFSTPGIVTFAMTWFSTKGVIPNGEGPILQLRFNVKAGALSGSQSPLDLADMGIYINAVSDTVGNLIIPVLTDGLFTVQ